MATEVDHHRNEPEKECVYKTKLVEFFGRTTPIILQDDNGPCPLIAICNVLLLKNNLDLGADCTDVSLQKLLSLVAERLIDSNSNVENKDAGYVENQQKNVADAIDLLPRLSTGIDVNIQFRRIDDFEFTPERAIFELLGIPLYHGWIVDPQDCDTANAIGSKSYNALIGELVSLETNNAVNRKKSYPEEDCIDFVAATTATLGVPTPCLSRARSFDDLPHSVAYHHKGRTGDVEEETELPRTLKLSTAESIAESLSIDANVNTHLRSSGLVVLDDSLDGPTCNEHHQPEKSTSQNCSVSSSGNNGGVSLDTFSSEISRSCTKVSTGDYSAQSSCKGSGVLDLVAQRLTPLAMDVSEGVNIRHQLEQSTSQNCNMSKSSDTFLFENSRSSTIVASGDHSDLSSRKEAGALDLVANHFRDARFQNGTSCACKYNMPEYGEVQQVQQSCLQDTYLSDNERIHDLISSSVPSARNEDFDFSCGTKQLIDFPRGVTSSLDGSEPMYEGEECILDTGLTIFEAREPIYEGEMVLVEQAERAAGACTLQQGYLVGNFLRKNGSQLTIYGLFCLQEGLKEHELCIFFRNNHFSTMFKVNGELYLLATDQGYINQPDLVWEKLNEVNGDSTFMTGNFKEFKLESHSNGTWGEQKVAASTADYLCSIDSSTEADRTFCSDMQLAIALQQLELENQS